MARLRTFSPALLPLLAACASGDAPATSATSQGEPVALLDYATVAPTTWESRTPASSMRLAEFGIRPTASDSAGAEVVVYYFGPGQGGSVEANTSRWQAQFFDEAGAHPEPSVTRMEDAPFPTTVVELRGRYARAVGMGGTQEEAVPDQILLAAVVEAPKGSLFIQLHGPSATVLAQRDSFYGFVRGIHPQESGGG